MLGEAGNAVKGVTDKVTGGPLGKAIDAITGSLTGSSGPPAPEGTARFMEGGAIDQDAQASDVQASPGDTQNTIGSPGTIQFLHLAYEHKDAATRFSGGVTSRGVAMRDALVRETVLLYSFAQGGRKVLQKNKDSKSAAGAMLATAGSLLGGAKQAPPGPEAFDSVLDLIRKAADPINQASFDYEAIHKAGIELAKAADSHNELCKSATSPEGAGGGGLPSIPGLDSVLGGAGVPKIVGLIPKWLFKLQDVYLAMYRESRIAYEWPLMKLSHDYSLDAIRGSWLPSYDVWRQRNREATEAAQNADDPSVAEKLLQTGKDTLDQDVVTLGSTGYGATDTGPGKAAHKALGDAQNAIKDIRTSGEDKAQMLAGLMSTAEDVQARMPPEAVAALAKAFALFGGDAAKGVKPLGDMMSDAIGKALFDGALPGFMKVYVGKLSEATIAVLDKVYRYTHAYGTPDPSLVLAATHDALASRIVGLIFSLILGRDPQAVDAGDQQKSAKSAVTEASKLDFGSAMDNAKSVVPSLDQAADKAADLVMQFLKSQGHHLDGIIIFVAKDLCDELVAAWMDANLRNASTMETYLGRLPMLAATVMRNLLFPVFNLVMEAFGMGDKFAGMAWNPVKDGIGRVTSVAQTVQQTKNDVRDTGNEMAAAGQRVDDAIDAKQTDIQNKAADLGNMDSTVSSLSDAEQLGREKSGQATDLGNAIGSTPNDLIDAAKGEDDAADAAAPEAPKGSGVLSASREDKGQAQAVTYTQIKTAGFETALAEDVILAERTGPAKAPAGAGAPAMPSLSDLGSMF
ncbi:hypothetical protein [Hydrocarboniphaga effusa]|uniref:hypothetical protein n=1 Tax=Hydrocarboniphaga effusa TaxID=243629 RepID=UPI003BA8F8A4